MESMPDTVLPTPALLAIRPYPGQSAHLLSGTVHLHSISHMISNFVKHPFQLILCLPMWLNLFKKKGGGVHVQKITWIYCLIMKSNFGIWRNRLSPSISLRWAQSYVLLAVTCLKTACPGM